MGFENLEARPFNRLANVAKKKRVYSLVKRIRQGEAKLQDLVAPWKEEKAYWIHNEVSPPLFMAIDSDFFGEKLPPDLEMFKYFLHEGVDPMTPWNLGPMKVHYPENNRQSIWPWLQSLPLDLIQAFVLAHKDINAVDQFGKTILINAIQAPLGKPAIQFIVDHGAKINLGTSNAMYETPLYAALAQPNGSCQYPIADYLLTRGANLCGNQKKEANEYVLQMMIRSFVFCTNLTWLKRARDCNWNFDTHTDETREQGLLYTIIEELEKMLDPRYDKDSFSGSFVSRISDLRQVVKILVEGGAEPDKKEPGQLLTPRQKAEAVIPKLELFKLVPEKK